MTDFRFPKLRFHRPRFGWPVIALFTALFIAGFDNRVFWRTCIDRLGPDSLSDWTLVMVFAIALVVLLNLAFTCVAFRWTFKPALMLFLLLSANVSYFAESFGVVIDQSMLRNILETNRGEAAELLTWPLAMHLTLYAAVPIALLLWTRVRYHSWPREVLVKGGILLGSLALVAVLGLANYKEITFFGRQNHDLQVYLNPTYPLHSLKKLVKNTYFNPADKPLQIIAADAKRPGSGARQVVVLVLGETARSQSFALNGYPRNTNPQLNNVDVVDYSNVESCGTATAESLPCMFSLQEHSSYSVNQAMRSQNLLDVLQRAGVEVVWRDNDSGSKGVAKRVRYQDLSKAENPKLCRDGNCYDEILLDGLDPLLTSSTGDMLIVLHTKGSHGPSYYKRTPPDFKVFLPECAQDNVQDCSQQEVVNAYDNTIVYTDYLLSKVIDILKNRDFATAMLYVSDHGESLGENGIYLHGLPYALAPAEQTHVPMIFWASDAFLGKEGINRGQLLHDRQARYSHDNLFHSMLGLFDITTTAYRQDLDIFASSRQALRAAAHGQGA